MASCTFLCLKWAVWGAIRAGFGRFLVTSGAFLLHLRRFSAGIYAGYKPMPPREAASLPVALLARAARYLARDAHGRAPGRRATFTAASTKAGALTSTAKPTERRTPGKEGGGAPPAPGRRKAQPANTPCAARGAGVNRLARRAPPAPAEATRSTATQAHAPRREARTPPAGEAETTAPRAQAPTKAEKRTRPERERATTATAGSPQREDATATWGLGGGPIIVGRGAAGGAPTRAT